MSNFPLPHISASQLNLFAGTFGCELAFKYQYIDKIPRGPTTASLYLGTSIDFALNQGHEVKIEDGVDPEPDLLAEAFVQTWRHPPREDRNGDQIDYDLSDAPKRVEDLGANAMIEYAKEVLPNVEPLTVQEQFWVDFEDLHHDDGAPILVPPLMGYLDLKEAARDGAVLVDNKTSLSRSKRWKGDDAAADLQLRIQDLAISQHERVVGRGWRGWQMLQTQVNYTEALIEAPNDHEQTLDLLGGLLKRLDRACSTGDFLPTAALAGSFKCSARFCSYWDKVCPHGRRARTSVPLTASVG